MQIISGNAFRGIECQIINKSGALECGNSGGKKEEEPESGMLQPGSNRNVSVCCISQVCHLDWQTHLLHAIPVSLFFFFLQIFF
jgi:hypothetical protein